MQKSLTECGVSECDLDMKGGGLVPLGLSSREKKKRILLIQCKAHVHTRRSIRRDENSI